MNLEEIFDNIAKNLECSMQVEDLAKTLMGLTKNAVRVNFGPFDYSSFFKSLLVEVPDRYELDDVLIKLSVESDRDIYLFDQTKVYDLSSFDSRIVFISSDLNDAFGFKSMETYTAIAIVHIREPIENLARLLPIFKHVWFFYNCSLATRAVIKVPSESMEAPIRFVRQSLGFLNMRSIKDFAQSPVYFQSWEGSNVFRDFFSSAALALLPLPHQRKIVQDQVMRSKRVEDLGVIFNGSVSKFQKNLSKHCSVCLTNKEEENLKFRHPCRHYSTCSDYCFGLYSLIADHALPVCLCAPRKIQPNSSRVAAASAAEPPRSIALFFQLLQALSANNIQNVGICLTIFPSHVVEKSHVVKILASFLWSLNFHLFETFDDFNCARDLFDKRALLISGQENFFVTPELDALFIINNSAEERIFYNDFSVKTNFKIFSFIDSFFAHPS